MCWQMTLTRRRKRHCTNKSRSDSEKMFSKRCSRFIAAIVSSHVNLSLFFVVQNLKQCASCTYNTEENTTKRMHSPGWKPAIFLAMDLDRFILEITASTHCTDAKQYVIERWSFLRTKNQHLEQWKAATGHVRRTNFVHGATEALWVKFPRAHASKETYKLN